MILVLLGSCTVDKSAQLETANKTGSVGFGESGLPEGESLGGEGGAMLMSEPGPLGAPQDLTDYNNTAIQSWGPIASTIQVQASQPGQPVQTFSVNIIETGDPFTPTYQLPSGTIVKSSLPPEELVFEELNDSHPPIVSWSGPNGTTDVFDGEILITFVPTADASSISSFLATHNLDVAFSWFRPDAVSGGNEIAWFQLEYDQQQFASFNAAYTYFSQQSLVDEASANEPFAYSLDYGGNSPNNIEPNDDHFIWGKCRYPREVGSALTTLVPFGPESGGSMSGQAIAVIDDGVWRQHEDLWVHSSGAPGSGLGNAGKISWVGVNIEGESIKIGTDTQAGHWYGNPHPSILDPERAGLMSHGTRVAGSITAGTNNDFNPEDQISVAGVAPSIMVLPIRMTYNWDEGLDRFVFDNASPYKAINALYDYFKPWQWEQRIRVANMSWSESKYRGSLRGIINEDQRKYDRLFVGSAGNNNSAIKLYPAAYDNVLGVTGLWRNENPDLNYWYSDALAGGSNYFNDSLATYPISGVYGYCNSARTDRLEFGQSTSPPGNSINPGSTLWNPNGEWEELWGTSACAPQVAGLAALMFTAQPSSTRQQVWQHIVNTRDDSMVPGLGHPLAGVVDYEEALSTW